VSARLPLLHVGCRRIDLTGHTHPAMRPITALQRLVEKGIKRLDLFAPRARLEFSARQPRCLILHVSDRGNAMIDGETID